MSLKEINRTRQLTRLQEGEEYDLLIVGGGATGLGTAVDAARRGYRVALVERADFGSATSSRSTKLVHGGVRYLKQGNIGLVRDALRERGRFLQNAPHLTRNMEFVIPAFSQGERAFYGAGLKAYDLLAGRWSLGRSLILNRQETLEHLPTLSSKDLKGGVLYHDGQFDDSRMTTNLMQTAVELGATVANYCECIRLIMSSAGRLTGAMVRDLEKGSEYSVRARVVINATGVFADALRQQDYADTPPMVAVSQGIHIVLPKRFLPGRSALMVPKTADGRVLFAVPWHDCVVVGTTDTPVGEAVMEPRALSEEYDFVMTHVAKYLEHAPGDGDVLSIFAGLRPLVQASRGKHTAALSRDHTIVISNSGMVTVTGGKWTTYRQMAQEVVDHAEKIAGWPHRPSDTANFPLHGATGSALPADHRLAIYGSDAAEIACWETKVTGEGERIHPELECSVAEVRWHVRHEMATTVGDVLSRRTRALLLNARAAAEAAPPVAAILAQELGRDAQWAQRQVTDFCSLARGYLPT